MTPSKVSLSKEIQENINNPTLSASRKQELRKERVIAFVRSQPAGTKLKITDLAAAAGYDTKTKKPRQAGVAFIRSLKKRGILSVDKDFKAHVGIWSVVKDVSVTPPPSTPEAIPNLSISNIETKAREFAWNKNSNDLREFINWLKEVGL